MKVTFRRSALLKWYWIVVAVMVVAGLAAIVLILVLPKSPLPPTIMKNFPSTVLVPGGTGVSVDRDSATYDAKQKFLHYTFAFDGIKVAVNEQPVPAGLSGSDGASQLLGLIGQYQKFDVPAGTLYLGKPKDLSGQQIGTMLASSTMMIITPDKILTDDQWRKLGASIVVAR